MAAWDDENVDWNMFDLVVVRSTWDYPLRRAEFLAWISSCRVTCNPADVIRWNTDKAYLRDLAEDGVPTIPTLFVDADQSGPITVPWDDYVVKPSVSGSAADTGRFNLDDAGALELLRHIHHQGRTAMVQPYIHRIEDYGETSLVYLAGEYSHAVRRQPLLATLGVRQPVEVADVLGTIEVVEPSSNERDVAELAMTRVPGGRHRLSYARVDLVPGREGALLLELEATDCFLFLGCAAEGAVAAFASHLAAAATR